MGGRRGVKRPGDMSDQAVNDAICSGFLINQQSADGGERCLVMTAMDHGMSSKRNDEPDLIRRDASKFPRISLATAELFS